MSQSFWENVSEQFQGLPTWAKTVVGAVVVGVPAYAFLSYHRTRKSPLKTDFAKGVVYVYQFPRSPVIPNISPFCLKLETWLRMADIHYENIDDCLFTRSKEGMLPFVELDGKEYADSNFIIRDLTKLLKKDTDAHLTKEQQGAARAFEQMIENSTIWSYAQIRYLEKIDELLSERILGMQLPIFFRLPFMMWSFKSAFKKRLIAHGIGRHSREEVINIGLDDLRALSNFIGGRKFLFGDQPTRADATIFGTLGQIVYLPIETPHLDLIRKECPNLKSYCDHIKERFWPDWDECLKSKSLHTTWKK